MCENKKKSLKVEANEIHFILREMRLSCGVHRRSTLT